MLCYIYPLLEMHVLTCHRKLSKWRCKAQKCKNGRWLSRRNTL